MKPNIPPDIIVQDHADSTSGRLSTVEGLDIVERIHLARYNYAATFTEGLRVLDIATGIGYGASIIATEGKAKEVFGADVSPEAIEVAKQKYPRNNINFTVVSGNQLPYENDFFDIIVSFETIEHTDNPEFFLTELKRTMKKNGTLLISTPNKRFHSFGKSKPWNPFHTIEYYPAQFLSIITKEFGDPIFWGGQELLTPTLKNMAKYNWTEFQYYELRHHQTRSKYFKMLINLKKQLFRFKKLPVAEKSSRVNFDEKRCKIEEWKSGFEPFTMVAACKK